MKRLDVPWLLGFDAPRIALFSAEELSAAVTSLPCALRMKRHADVRYSTRLISPLSVSLMWLAGRINALVVESRRLTINLTQMFTFLMFHYLLLSMMQLAVHAVLLPPIFSGMQVWGP